MYTHSTIIAALRGLIGFEQPYNADIAIDADLSTSRSGLYANLLHPLLAYENILACAEQFGKTNVRTWSSTATYQAGDVVKSGATLYRALQDNTNHATSETDYWTVTTLLSAYLRRIYDQSANRLVNTLFTEKKLHEVAKTILGSLSLYEGVGNISGRITKNNRLVGFRIKLKHKDTAALLHHIGLQLDTAQNPVNIYLYHSGSYESLQTFTLNHTKSISQQWHPVTATLNDATGYYYLVYKESELTGSAVKKDVSFFGKQSCGSCSEAIANAQLYNRWSKLVTIQPFYVNNYSGSNLWDEDQEIYIPDSNWGLNLQLSVKCDVTGTLTEYSDVFTNALAQQLVVSFLNEMAFSLRLNGQKEMLAGLAATALDNQENGQHGEAKKLTEAIKALSFDFSSLSEVCLPCDRKPAVRIGNVWGR
jgi:hypothetical protein